MTPRHFTPEETAAFLRDYRTLYDVTGTVNIGEYVDRGFYGTVDPPQGIIVAVRAQATDTPRRQVLVWIDTTRHLHVVDVTGHPVAGEIPKARFESPDSNLIDSFLSSITDAGNTLLWIAAGAAALIIVTRR